MACHYIPFLGSSKLTGPSTSSTWDGENKAVLHPFLVWTRSPASVWKKDLYLWDQERSVYVGGEYPSRRREQSSSGRARQEGIKFNQKKTGETACWYSGRKCGRHTNQELVWACAWRLCQGEHLLLNTEKGGGGDSLSFLLNVINYFVALNKNQLFEGKPDRVSTNLMFAEPSPSISLTWCGTYAGIRVTEDKSPALLGFFEKWIWGLRFLISIHLLRAASWQASRLGECPVQR